VRISGPKLTARQWFLTLLYIFLTMVFALGVSAYFLIVLPEKMLLLAMGILGSIGILTTESINHRRAGRRRPLGLLAYLSAIFAIFNAIMLGTLVTPQLSTQPLIVVRILWTIVALGIPIAWWISNLGKGESEIQSSPPV